jgi:NTE family protein
MPTALRVAAYDVDSGERALFGAPGLDDTPVSLACAASLALPLFFSPVRVGSRHYLEGGLGRVAHLDVAEDEAVRLAVVVNPLVPVSVERRGVPTGHGVRESVRDKGLLWLYNQASRIGAHERLGRDIERVHRGGKTRVLLIEPRPSDAQLFLHNPSANLDVRRAILEYAFRTTRERMERWVEEHREALAEAGVM